MVTGTKKTRSLKIEETGDFARAQIIPGIRLRGQWLAAAGFPPGARVRVTVLASGLIQLEKEK